MRRTRRIGRGSGEFVDIHLTIVRHWVADEIQVLVGEWAFWADDTGFGEQKTADLADEFSVMMWIG